MEAVELIGVAQDKYNLNTAVKAGMNHQAP
jgi:hypothetical protein